MVKWRNITVCCIFGQAVKRNSIVCAAVGLVGLQHVEIQRDKGVWKTGFKTHQCKPSVRPFSGTYKINLQLLGVKWRTQQLSFIYLNKQEKTPSNPWEFPFQWSLTADVAAFKQGQAWREDIFYYWHEPGGTFKMSLGCALSRIWWQGSQISCH